MSDIVFHGKPADPQLVPDVVNAYYANHGDAVFSLPPKADLTPPTRVTLKLFGWAHNRVQIKEHDDDGGAIRWHGSTGGDYVTLELHAWNGHWYVFDHYETVILRLNKDNHQSIPAGAFRQVTSWHIIEDTAKIGFANELVVPWSCRMDLVWGMIPGKVTSQSGLSAEVRINSTILEPHCSQLVQGSAHGFSYTPWSTVGFILGGGATVQLCARNLESDKSTHVDARSEAWIRLRWRL